MDKKAMYKSSYGLFVLTAREGDKDNGSKFGALYQKRNVLLQGNEKRQNNRT